MNNKQTSNNPLSCDCGCNSCDNKTNNFPNMKLNELKEIIKKEIRSIINESNPKFSKGDNITYMGTKHTIISDDGYSIKASTPSGKIVNLNYNQIKGHTNENTRPQDLKDIPIQDLTPGRYNVSYIVADPDGGGDYGDDGIFTLTDSDINNKLNHDFHPLNFWKAIAWDMAKARIYKVVEVTKL